MLSRLVSARGDLAVARGRLTPGAGRVLARRIRLWPRTRAHRVIRSCAFMACPKIALCLSRIDDETRTGRTARTTTTTANRIHFQSVTTARRVLCSPLRSRARAPLAFASRPLARSSHKPVLTDSASWCYSTTPLEPCTPGFHATDHIAHTSGRGITVGHARSSMGPMPSTHCGASTG